MIVACGNIHHASIKTTVLSVPSSTEGKTRATLMNNTGALTQSVEVTCRSRGSM